MSILNVVLENLDTIVIALGVGVFLYSRWKADREISLQDLKDSIEIGVNIAERKYIKSGGKEDVRRLEAIEEALKFLGVKERTPELIDAIAQGLDFAINQLPKTSEMLKKEKVK